jgi:hypothetical protein
MWVFVLFFLVTPASRASEIIHLQELSLQYGRYRDGGRTSLFDGPKEQIDLNLDWTVFRFLYFQNTVHSWTDSGNFKQIGWEYSFGVHVFGGLDIGLYHFSQHLLDTPNPRTPQETAIYFKLYIYSSDKRNSVF